jgi:chemotaxis protein CheZ
MRRAAPTAAAEAGRRNAEESGAAAQSPSPEAIRDAVEEMLSTMEGDLTADHVNVSAQLRALAQYIETTRKELGRLRPSDIAERHIPNATDELDAIVKETEEATNAIMQAAEGIESVTAALQGETQTTLSDAVTKIYESCSFQDITGQRIGKVVRALKEIEAKVGQMVATLDGKAASQARSEDAPAAPEAADGDSRLLNGPQLPGGAISQDDIDSLFAKTD